MRNFPIAAADLKTPNSKGPLHDIYDPPGITGYEGLSMYLCTKLTNMIFRLMYFSAPHKEMQKPLTGIY